MTAFPHQENYAQPKVANGKVTFAYADSFGNPVQETRPLLTPSAVIRMVRARTKRFMAAGVSARESDKSRRERKYIAAQPKEIIKAAWDKAGDMERMELQMMLDRVSHDSISSPSWLAEYAEPKAHVIGDDGKPLDQDRAPQPGRPATVLA